MLQNILDLNDWKLHWQNKERNIGVFFCKNFKMNVHYVINFEAILTFDVQVPLGILIWTRFNFISGYKSHII